MTFCVYYICPKTKMKWYLWQFKDEIASWNTNRSCAKKLSQAEADYSVAKLKAFSEFDGVDPEDWTVEEL